MEGVYRNWSWRWGWWVDEELFAAAYTVVVEGFGHVNVDDVDTGGLGIGDSLIDGAIQAGCGVVDLGQEEVRIVKQERIASGHDECVGCRLCHIRVQISETPPELAFVSALGRQEEIRQPYGILALLRGSGRTRC